MSKKTLLNETQVRRFMKLSQLGTLSDGFVDGLSEAGYFTNEQEEELPGDEGPADDLDMGGDEELPVDDMAMDDEPELDLEGDWLDDEVGSAHTMQTQPPSRSLWALIIVLVALLAAWTIFLLIGQSGSSDSGASNLLQMEEVRPILGTAQPTFLK